MSNKTYAILTDSACDLTLEDAEKYNIDILCFSITVDQIGYTERKDFTPEEYYEILRTCKGMPSTSLVTSIQFLEQFEKYNNEGIEDVIYVSICGAGSNTLEAAKIAQTQFYDIFPSSKMKIHIIDGTTYSIGYGYPLMEASRRLQNGAEMDFVLNYLQETLPKTTVLIGAYSLKFIKKSGRINAAAAFAGELLGLRPIITLKNGVSKVQTKVRGDKNVIPALFKYADEHMDHDADYFIGGTGDEYIQELAKYCEKKFGKPPTTTFLLGPAVATNTGPDTSTIIFYSK